MEMESSKSMDPLQEEGNLAAIRRKNTTLIAILFSFIVSLSLILCGVIVYLVFHNDSDYPTPNPAVYGFCSVVGSQIGCISSLSSHNAKRMVFTDPVHVYTFSLELAAEELSLVGPVPSGNCSTSLRPAAARIYKALAIIPVDPENEKRVCEKSGRMAELVVAAMEELRSCRESTAPGELAGTRVHRSEMLLRYSRDYLLNCDLVNRRFHFRVVVLDERSRNPILGVVVDSAAVFWLQYFVIVFLFILILLRCNFCYIGGWFHRV